MKIQDQPTPMQKTHNIILFTCHLCLEASKLDAMLKPVSLY